MKPLLALATLASLGCAIGSRGAPASQVPIWVRSNNGSEVDVYLLCGDSDARWLGVVPEKGAAAFEIPVAQTRCPWGLNFFLVVRDQGRGYWAGPVRPRADTRIDLVIEKYAGLSTTQVRNQY